MQPGNYCRGPVPGRDLSGGGSLVFYGPFEAYVSAVARYAPDRYAYVYHLFNDFGDLLYVGRTINPTRRFNEHRLTQPWWSEVVTVALYCYSRFETAAAERLDITELAPLYNIAGVPV